MKSSCEGILGFLIEAMDIFFLFIPPSSFVPSIARSSLCPANNSYFFNFPSLKLIAFEPD